MYFFVLKNLYYAFPRTINCIKLLVNKLCIFTIVIQTNFNKFIYLLTQYLHSFDMKTFFSASFIAIFFLVAFTFNCFATIEYKAGVIYNMQGPKASAWSLTGDSEKWLYQSDLEKDIINTTKITDPLPFFRRELISVGSSFVKTTNKFTMKEANYESLKSYFEKNKSTSIIKDLKVGDTYILKLKNAGGYAILKISKIHDDHTSLLYDGNNLDFIGFDYSIFKPKTIEAVSFIEDDFEEEVQPYWETDVEMLIYPNPVVDKLNIKFRKVTDSIGWVVLLENTNGEKIFISEDIYEAHWTKDVKELPSGRYILSVMKENTVYLQKVIDKNDSKISELYQ